MAISTSAAIDRELYEMRMRYEHELRAMREQLTYEARRISGPPPEFIATAKPSEAEIKATALKLLANPIPTNRSALLLL